MVRAWLIWFLSALFMCYKYAIEVSPSVMTGDFMSEFSLSGAQMGHLAASYFYAYLMLQIPGGMLLDRWGPRFVTGVAIVFCSLGALLLGLAPSLPFALFGRFLSGAGAAFAAMNCLKLIANWFPVKQFAMMAGLMMSVGMLGAVAGQAPLSHFITFLGWRQAMIVLAGVGAFLSLFFVLVVRDRAPHKQELDLLPEKMSLSKHLKRILSNPQSWILSFYSGFAFAPVSAFGGLWGVPFLQKAYGMTESLAARGASFLFIGFALGAPLFGWISDRIKKRKPIMFWGTLLGGTSLCAVLYVPGLSIFLVFFLLFSFGFFISAFLLCFTMIKEIHTPLLAATAIGFMNAFDALFGAFSDPLTGKLLDLGWTGQVIEGARSFPLSAYHWSLSILIVYLLCSLVTLSRVKESHCKQVFPTSMP